MVDDRMMAGLPDYHLISVFEAANDTLREVYVGTTSLLMDQLIRGFQTTPPKAVRHWKGSHRVLYRCVVYSIAVSEAEEFIDGYLRSDALKGWKPLRDEKSTRERNLVAKPQGADDSGQVSRSARS